jgi:uncharacterized protein (DUF1778 family)
LWPSIAKKTGPPEEIITNERNTSSFRIDAAMQGALQMIVEELELKGRVKLADDCSEMLVEEDEPASPQ